MLASSFNLLQSFNYAPYLFCKKRLNSEINCFLYTDPGHLQICEYCPCLGGPGGGNQLIWQGEYSGTVRDRATILLKPPLLLFAPVRSHIRDLLPSSWPPSLGKTIFLIRESPLTFLSSVLSSVFCMCLFLSVLCIDRWHLPVQYILYHISNINVI